MLRITLGRSGLKVSPICFGTWQLSPKFLGEQPKDPIIAAIRRAFDLGVNFIDTADAYGNGHAETVVGEALRALPRDEVVIATKVFHRFYPDGRRHGDLSRDYVLAECDASLKRLGTDRIDLYQCHSFDMSTPVEETAEAMETLTLTHLVLVVTLQTPMIDCAIIGVKKPEHIEEAAAAMGRTVSREHFHRVRQALS